MNLCTGRLKGAFMMKDRNVCNLYTTIELCKRMDVIYTHLNSGQIMKDKQEKRWRERA